MRLKIFFRRAVWTLLGLATLIALFYAEEDWRGALSWEAAKDQYRVRGETLDAASFIPFPTSDAVNLGALPIFMQVRKDQSPGGLVPVALEQAMRISKAVMSSAPQAGDPTANLESDLSKTQGGACAEFRATFRSPSKDSPRVQFEAVHPAIALLRDAAKTRPRCRFNLDYEVYPPAARGYRLFNDLVDLAGLFAVDADLALAENEEFTALDDVHVILLLAEGAELGKDDSGFCALRMRFAAEGTISLGLALHVWTDPQLTNLIELLDRVDFLRSYQNMLRICTADQALNLQYLQQHPKILKAWTAWEKPFPHAELIYSLRPAGWTDETRASLLRNTLTLIADADIPDHLFFPERVEKLWHAYKPDTREEIRWQPWRIWFRLNRDWLEYGPLIYARSQVVIDHVRLACALERYRLTHGDYPPSPSSVAPFLKNIPHDIVGGAPYHYRLTRDGGYLLYSIGWNERDDGGSVVKANSQMAPGLTDGDWVWFGAK
jgi:hypothetical protein